MKYDDVHQPLARPVARLFGAMLSCLLWGSAIPIIKKSYEIYAIDSGDAGSLLIFAGTRFALAGLLVLVFYSIRQKKVTVPGKEQWSMILKVSLFQTFLQYFTYYLALRYTTGVSASILVGTNTFFSIALAAGILKIEKMTANKIWGCVIGFAGVLLSQVSGGMQWAFSFRGEGMILISAMCAAVSAVLIKRYSAKIDPMFLSGWQFLIGGLLLRAIGSHMGGEIQVTSGSYVLTVLYLAMVSAVAYTVWALLLKYNPVSKVTVFGFMTPVCGVVLSALILGETGMITVRTLLALVLVSIGIYVVNRENG